MKIALTTPEKSVTATNVLDFTLDKLKFLSMLSNTIEFMARVKVMRKLQSVKTARKLLGVAMNCRQSGLTPITPYLLLLLFSSSDKSSALNIVSLFSHMQQQLLERVKLTGRHKACSLCGPSRACLSSNQSNLVYWSIVYDLSTNNPTPGVKL